MKPAKQLITVKRKRKKWDVPSENQQGICMKIERSDDKKEVTIMNNSYLEHHGIKGMKWGVRRYQNEDGSLTKAGERRYYNDSYKEAKQEYKNAN